MSASSSAVTVTPQRRHGYFNLKRTYNPIIDKWMMENGLDYAIFYPSFINWIHRTVRRNANRNVTMIDGEMMVMKNVYEYNLSDEAPAKYVEALEYYRKERWGGHERPTVGMVRDFGSDAEIVRAEDALLAALITKHKVDHPEMWDGDRGLMMPPKKKARRAAVLAQHDDDDDDDDNEKMTTPEVKHEVEGSSGEGHEETAMEVGDEEGEQEDDGDTRMAMDSDDDYNPPEPVSPGRYGARW
ncbi:MAG: hypothetical protein M1812_005948 [Candelaria pacifica]|nr:MAG: hypothetical protein M1812_005948 [Candelaria pacifica]